MATLTISTHIPPTFHPFAFVLHALGFVDITNLTNPYILYKNVFHMRSSLQIGLKILRFIIYTQNLAKQIWLKTNRQDTISPSNWSLFHYKHEPTPTENSQFAISHCSTATSCHNGNTIPRCITYYTYIVLNIYSPHKYILLLCIEHSYLQTTHNQCLRIYS